MVLFTSGETRLIRTLDTPEKVQRWLRALAYNRETRGETLRTFRVVRRLGRAHCLEGALAAATILEAHGYPPLLLDMESQDRLDHVAFLFRDNGRYGTVAKSRDPGLDGRKPFFLDIKSLVQSYFEPYIDQTGKITAYAVYNLEDLRGVDWQTSERNVWKVERTLLEIPHRRLVTSMARYERAHRRFLAYRRRFPDRMPVYFRNRHQWW